jgi:hypothetical protein
MARVRSLDSKRFADGRPEIQPPSKVERQKTRGISAFFTLLVLSIAAALLWGSGCGGLVENASSSSTTPTHDGGTSTQDAAGAGGNADVADAGGNADDADAGGNAGGCGWDGSPLSSLGGPCGGNLWQNPPTCGPGLSCCRPGPSCFSGSADAVGTCASQETVVSDQGGQCNGATPALCAWDLVCNAEGGSPGTCEPCSAGAGGPEVDGG